MSRVKSLTARCCSHLLSSLIPRYSHLPTFSTSSLSPSPARTTIPALTTLLNTDRFFTTSRWRREQASLRSMTAAGGQNDGGNSLGFSSAVASPTPSSNQRTASSSPFSRTNPKPVFNKASTTTTASSPSLPPQARPVEEWRIQKAALARKLKGQAWNPPKRVSPDAMACIRALHDQFPEQMTTPVLAREFEISADAVRRILRRRWNPTEEDERERRERWRRRGERIWSVWKEQGYKVPRAFRSAVEAEGGEKKSGGGKKGVVDEGEDETGDGKGHGVKHGGWKKAERLDMVEEEKAKIERTGRGVGERRSLKAEGDRFRTGRRVSGRRGVEIGDGSGSGETVVGSRAGNGRSGEDEVL